MATAIKAPQTNAPNMNHQMIARLKRNAEIASPHPPTFSTLRIAGSIL